MNLDQASEANVALNKCKLMEKIVHQMLQTGYLFDSAERITNRLEHGIFLQDDLSEENTIVRIRGEFISFNRKESYNF